MIAFTDMPIDRLSRLDGVDPRLIFILLDGVLRYYQNEDPNETANWRVTCGRRTQAEQARLVREGKSQTLHSYHIDGRAVDLAAMSHDWSKPLWDLDLYQTLDKYIQQASNEAGIPVTWGGHWKTLVDGCHWQIELLPNGRDSQF